MHDTQHTSRQPLRLSRFAHQRRTGLLAALATAASTPLPAWAQTPSWPTRQIRMIVNFPPGGAADVLARAIAPTLSQMLEQTVVVDNRAGAGGNIGIAEAVRSPNDGHTLLLSSGGAITINPMIYRSLAFNPEQDLTPVAAVARVHLYLETHPDVPVNTVADFIGYLKANPGKLSYGSPGQGSSPHLAGEMFKRMAAVDAVHIPYKGGAPALNDVLAGQLQFWFDPGPGLQHAAAGKLRMLAIGSPQRSPQYPDLPTLHESGLTGFDADTLFGVYAPAGVPDTVVVAVRAAVEQALTQDNVIRTIMALGATPAPMSRQAFIDHHTTERQRFGPLVQSIGLRVD